MKKLLALILSLAIVLTAVGCTMNAPVPAQTEAAPAQAEASTADESAAEVKELTVGYTPQSMEFSYFQDVVKGMEDVAAETTDYKITVVVKDPQMDAGKQLTAAEELVAAGSDVIIVCSVDLAAMPSIVSYIKDEKNLPLIGHQSPFEGADCYVALEDYGFGRIGGNAAGKYIAENMDGKATIAILHGKVVGENLVQRYQGYVDGITEYAPNVEIVSEASGYEEEMAMQALESILTEHPEVNFVVATNDPGALGAYAAVEAAGMTDQVKICGIGSEQRVLEYIRDGKILYSVGDSAYKTGRILMDNAIKMFEGKEVEKDQVIDCTLIDTAEATAMLNG